MTCCRKESPHSRRKQGGDMGARKWKENRHLGRQEEGTSALETV